MFVDINLQNNFKISETHYLENESWDGYCVNKTLNQSDLCKPIDFNLSFKLKNKNLYKKITLILDNNYTPPKTLLKTCDLLCLHVKNIDIPVDEGVCDLVKFDLTKPHKLKNINPNLFYEITISDALYNKKERMMWMYNVKMLITFTKGKNLVVGTGASCYTELKTPLDIQKMFQVFGLSEDKVKRIMENNIRLLKKCAEKRYLVNGCVFNNLPEGNLKKDFLIN